MSKKDEFIYNYVLSEKDFYPPPDNRVLKSNIKEIYTGEFHRYARSIFNLYESEDYYEN